MCIRDRVSASAQANERFGGLIRLMYLAWLGARLWHPKEESLVSPGRFRVNDILIWMHLFVWLELSMERLSTALLNHGAVNAIVIGFGCTHRLTIPLLSVVMITLFCYRRRRHAKQGPSEESLVLALDQVGKLVRLVLESGDELCSTSRAMLEQALLMTQAGEDGIDQDEEAGVCPRTFQHPGPCELTQSKLGVGTGRGAWASPLGNPTAQDDAPFGGPLAELAAQNDQCLLGFCRDGQAGTMAGSESSQLQQSSNDSSVASGRLYNLAPVAPMPTPAGQAVRCTDWSTPGPVAIMVRPGADSNRTSPLPCPTSHPHPCLLYPSPSPRDS
eukprot:TRINITY_DN1115_c0_g2_i4.p1 TRINITY_DN1115_c0_g2~~TRINITY_DN1115_c0_g2_i4.p1  ORF type:complete len:330 (+),score=37.15 TRINITY_DN1115_c0_g2_i4:157-1146(+)